MAKSLLAHMYSRIRGSQEDVATIALQYLVSQSKDLKQAFTHLLEAKLETSLSEDLQYTCQAVGEEKERPDMAGTDRTGKEVVLCEMKFYAGLTHNQPLGYLKRLKQNGGIGLVFVCPQNRQTSLWSKLLDLCSNHDVISGKGHCVTVDGVRMAIMTWGEVIESLHNVASATSSIHLSDIQQLKGFCEQMDSDAFIPFAPEDLTADKSIGMKRYYSVIDKVYDLLWADHTISTVALGKASFYRTGYERKMSIDDIPVYFTFDLDMWKTNSSEETPFWVAIGDRDIQASDEFKKFLFSIDERNKEDSVWSLVYFPLTAPIDSTLEEVCEEIKRQILNFLNIAKTYIAP